MPETYSFWDLHVAIQDAMGWFDSHLHQFDIINPATGMMVEIGIPDEDFGRDILSDWNQKIANYFTMENSSANYVYDFGDGWEHKVELEKIVPRDANTDYPICITGRRACPPEDVGGLEGYREFLEVITSPSHEDHEAWKQWAGGDFDPTRFDARARTKAMQRGLPDWRQLEVQY